MLLYSIIYSVNNSIGAGNNRAYMEKLLKNYRVIYLHLAE